MPPPPIITGVPSGSAERMSEEQTVQGVDVVGCDAGDNGRSCVSHEICGNHVHVGDVIVFRWEVVPIEEDMEEVVKAYLIRDGSQTCHIGFLPRRLLKQKGKFVNKMAIVVEDLRTSENSQKRRRSHRNMGIVYCTMLDAIEEQFRQ